MWMDVFSGVSLCRAPRFLGLYQRLFQPKYLNIAQSLESTMEGVMGCPNAVVLAFAEIAALEEMKMTGQARNAMGMVDPLNLNGWGAQIDAAEIEMRGAEIERNYIPEAFGPAALPMNRFMQVNENVDTNSIFAGIGLDFDDNGFGIDNGNTKDVFVDPSEENRAKIAEVFRHSARVYLHSVISGCDPLNPTIRRAWIATKWALEVRY